MKCRLAVAFFAFIDWLIERCTVAGYVNANWRAAAGGACQLATLFALLANLQFTEGNERERWKEGRRVFCSRQALFLEHYAARSNYKMANRNSLFIDSLEGDAEPEDVWGVCVITLRNHKWQPVRECICALINQPYTSNYKVTTILRNVRRYRSYRLKVAWIT